MYPRTIFVCFVRFLDANNRNFSELYMLPLMDLYAVVLGAVLACLALVFPYPRLATVELNYR